MGIRSKVIVFVVGFVIVLVGTLGTVSLRLQQKIYEEEMAIRGRSLLEALSIPIASALANLEIEALDTYVAEVTEGGKAVPLDIQSVMILDHKGHVLAHTNPGEFGKIYMDLFTQQAMSSSQPVAKKEATVGPPLMKVSLPVVSGKRWGTLIAVFSLDRITQRIAASRKRLIFYTALFIFLAGTGTFVILSRLVVKPIVELDKASQKIQAGTLSARVKIRANRKDEVGHLVKAFNKMADALQGYTQKLEQKVEKRTRELQKLNQELLNAKDHLEELAITDGLTGLFNYRYLIETLRFEMQRQERLAHPLCYLMIDVDHFKQYNDRHGHPAGDEVLQTMGKLFKEMLRGIDVIARYGGEEFAILLLDTEKQAGITVAENVRHLVEQYPFPKEHSQPGGRLTISLGLANYPIDASDMDSLIRMADTALYRAKQQGRNCVEVW